MKHLEEKHAEEIAFECLQCEESVAGGLKMFILHQMMHHPDTPPIKLLGTVNKLTETAVELEKNSPPINVTCPFCQMSNAFAGKYALKEHIEELHGDKLDVLSLIKSLKFVVDKRNLCQPKNEEENDSSKRDPSTMGQSSRNEHQSTSSAFGHASKIGPNNQDYNPEHDSLENIENRSIKREFFCVILYGRFKTQ